MSTVMQNPLLPLFLLLFCATITVVGMAQGRRGKPAADPADTAFLTRADPLAQWFFALADSHGPMDQWPEADRHAFGSKLRESGYAPVLPAIPGEQHIPQAEAVHIASEAIIYLYGGMGTSENDLLGAAASTFSHDGEGSLPVWQLCFRSGLGRAFRVHLRADTGAVFSVCSEEEEADGSAIRSSAEISGA